MVEEMMQVFSAVFYFLCGWILVLAVLMALLMLIYIVNITVQEIFHVNPIVRMLERIDRWQKQEDSSMK